MPGGCPIAAALFEFDDVECPARDMVLRMQAEWRKMVAEIVHETVATGELPADLDVDQFVWELCSIYLKHHVSTRFAVLDRRDAASGGSPARSGRQEETPSRS